MAITIYDFSSGVGSGGIEAIVQADKVYYKNFNRPLKRLVENDQSIITQLDHSIITNELRASIIRARYGSSLTIKGDMVIEGNVSVLGSSFTVSSSDLAVRDNIIIINASQVLDSTGVAGIEIDRGTEDSAYAYFKNEDKYWHFSNSGIKGQTALFSTITASRIDAEYIDFSKIAEPNPPVATKERLYFDLDGIAQYKSNDSVVTRLGYGANRYNVYIHDQNDWEAYFGNSALTSSGVTDEGIAYSNISGRVTVYPPENVRIMIGDGEYNISTYVALANGLTIHGKDINQCRLIAVDSGVGFGNLSGSWVENVDMADFIMDARGMALSESSLFNVDGVKNSRFRNKCINVNASYVYDGGSDNFNVEVGDTVDSPAVVVKGLKFGKIIGNFENNIKTAESNESVIMSAYVDGAPYLGIGNWDF